ncbi:MAG: glycosyltransferase family 4 protein [Pyrinomonadaceae bacterium]|nr:glycosyltransferase family 4 protein [Pyrinomonadaceae bacterium]
MTSLCFVVESGTDVRLVEGLAERFDLSILARRIEGGVEISQPPVKSIPCVVGPASRVKFALLVWKYLREHGQQIDCVIVQGYGMAALAANLAGRLNRTPTAMLVCSPVQAYYRCRKAHAAQDKPFRRRELWALEALARMNALVGRQYIVLSQHLAHVVRQHGSSAPVAVIPIYGVDTRVFTPPSESKTAIRARLGLPTTGALIFFSSRIAPEKDSETLLAAMRRLLDNGRDLWLLHRSGGYKTTIKDSVRFGVAERVIASDAVHPHSQLPLDYQASDLCVQASREEGLSFSPLEALACGVPVIAAAVGGLKETIRDGQTGWTYPVGDPEALTKSIESALDDPAEAARRATRGREMVGNEFERGTVFGQVERLMLTSKRSELSNKFVESL